MWLGEPIAGEVAAVTGGARGLGRATALAFAAEGAHVAVIDVGLNGATQYGELLGAATIADEIAAAGVRGVGIQVDLTDRDAVGAAFARVADQLRPVDILANVVGGTIVPLDVSQPPTGPLDDVRTMFEVNYYIALYCLQAEAPAVKAPGPRGDHRCYHDRCRADRARRPIDSLQLGHGGD